MGRNMIINQNHNILYKERIGHKNKSIVAKKTLSENNFNEPPFKRESNDISFKGGFSSLKKILEPLLYKNTKQFDYTTSLKNIKKYYNSSVSSLINGINPNTSIQKNIIRVDNTEKVQFKEKKFLKQVTEGIIYPLKLPIHIVDSFLEILRKKQIVNVNYGKTQNSIFGRYRNKLDDSDKFNSLIGFVKSADKYKYDSEKVRSAGLFRDGMKAFDPKSGNYNSVHERALTRIVTGFIPAFFLATDAYNLSRLCDDNPKLAEKEKKLRFNQESKRVLSNAYIQLITLGALAKFVNSSKAAFVTVTVLTTLFTEIYSRLSNGKKIHFISKEEAQKINKKEKEKLKNSKEADSSTSSSIEEKEQNSIPGKKEQINSAENSKRPGFKSSMVFKDFAVPSNISFTDRTQSDVHPKSDETAKELKPLLNPQSILTWIVGTIAIGYAIKGGKYGYKKLLGNKKLADKAIIKSLKKIEKNHSKRMQSLEKFLGLEKIKGKSLFEKIYNKITTKEHLISQEEFNDITQKLNSYDPKLSSKFHQVTMNYQKYEKIKEFSAEFAKDLRSIGLNKISDNFENISKGKFDDIRKNKVIANQFKNFYNQLVKQKEVALAEDIRAELIAADGSIKTENYEKLSKMLKRVSKARPESQLEEFSMAFDNIFRVDKDEENLKLFYYALDEIRKLNKTEIYDKYNNALNAATNIEHINLGRQNRFIVKEVTDLFIQPFKFIWNTITFPYKLATKVESFAKPKKLPEWKPEIETVSNSIKKLNKTYNKIEKQVNKWNTRADRINSRAIRNGNKPQIVKKDVDAEFAKIMNKKISKAFNTVTMSNISNAELSELAKYSTTAATAWFLIADNYNMVMLKSNGENQKEAGMKAKERAMQETSRLFYSQMLINLFNNTFRNVYNNSLFGAQAVNAVSTSLGEYLNRVSIGIPVKECTKDEIIKQDEENLNRKDAKGKIVRFMSRLTGKRALTLRENKTQEAK